MAKLPTFLESVVIQGSKLLNLVILEFLTWAFFLTGYPTTFVC